MSGVATVVERIREVLSTLSEQERRRALAELSLLPCTVRFEDVVLSDEDDISWVDDAEYDGLSDAEIAAQMNEIGGWIDADVAVPRGATLRLCLDWRMDFSCDRLSIEAVFDDKEDRNRFTPEEVEILEAELIPTARSLIENLLQQERLAEPFDVLRRVRRLERERETPRTRLQHQRAVPSSAVFSNRFRTSDPEAAERLPRLGRATSSSPRSRG